MQKKQPMKKLGALLPAMSVALAVGLAVPQQAHALRDLLFPYVTTEAGKYTFISILNDGSTFGSVPTSYHFTYGMKPVPVNPKTGCSHGDSDVMTTPADMMIFEASGAVTTNPGTYVLFEGGPGDAPVTSSALVFPAGYAGFLSVSQPTTSDAYAHGWASVIDSANGVAWTYSTDMLTSGSLATAAATNYTNIEGADRKFLSWYPAAVVPTSWYVLPLGTEAAMSVSPNIRRGLSTSVDHTVAGAPAGTQGAFDLDEHFFSGGKKPAIRCLGFMTRSDFLDVMPLANTANGGWVSTVSAATFTLPTTDATDPAGTYVPGPHLIYKIQSTTALGAMKTTINKETPHDYTAFAPL